MFSKNECVYQVLDAKFDDSHFWKKKKKVVVVLPLVIVSVNCVATWEKVRV